MTDRERADEYLAGVFGPENTATHLIKSFPGAWEVFSQVRHTLPKLIAAVRSEEWERCAVACESIGKDIVCPEECAAAIRAMHEPTP